MNKKVSLSLMIILLTIVSLGAYSQDGKHSAHVSVLYSSKLESVGFGAAYYYRSGKFAEFGFTYETTLPKDKLRLTSIGASYHLSIQLTYGLLLYPLVGVSYVVLRDDTPDELRDEYAASFDFGAGLRYKLSRHFEVGLKYKFSTYTLDIFKNQSLPSLTIGYAF